MLNNFLVRTQLETKIDKKNFMKNTDLTVKFMFTNVAYRL